LIGKIVEYNMSEKEDLIANLENIDPKKISSSISFLLKGVEVKLYFENKKKNYSSKIFINQKQYCLYFKKSKNDKIIHSKYYYFLNYSSIKRC
jgi:hypothetical protein